MRKWFVIVASLAVLLTLVRAAGFGQVAGVWRSLEARGILLSVSCYYASIVVRVLAWRRLLGPESPPLLALGPPLGLGFVLGHVTPAKTGEPATALLASRAFGLPLSRTLSVLTAERAIQLLVLLLTFVPAAALQAGRVFELRGTVALAAALLALLGAGTLFAPPVLRRLEPLAGRVPRLGRPGAEYLRALAGILSSRRRVIPLVAFAAAFWFLQYLSLWAILDAGGAPVNLLGAAVVAGAAILGGTLSLLPLGTQDGISALVLGGLGVPLARGFALALFHTVLSLACGLALLATLPLLGTRRR